MDPSAEELSPEDKENPSRKGRPKGSKNKRKRGRPKSKKKYVYRPKKKEIDNSDVQIPELPQIKNYKAKEVFVIPNTLDATPVIEAEAPKFSQDTVIESLLDDEKLKEESLHVPKEINQEPLDPSYYYRGSKNIPVAGAEYAFTADMVEELRKCQEDIVYFAENFFHIVTLDKRGKSKIKLYEAQKKMLLNMVNHRFTANLSCRQSGKALALDTPIRTTKGWKTMGELTTKDKVYGSNGTPINITHVHGVLENRECYKVTFDNGEEIIADAEHQWFTQHRKERQKKITGSVKTTKQILDTLYAPYSKEPGHRIPVCTNGLLLGSADLPIEPYVLGYWLGDGASEGGSIIVGNRDLNFVINKLKQSKQFDSITTRTYEYCNSTYVTISVSSDKHKNSLSSILRKIGLIHNKHIPEIYFSANREQKLELLRGLMDSDGYIDKNGNAYFYNTNKILAEQVLALTQELGYKPTFLNRVAKLKGIAKKIVYTVSFTPREQVVTIPFKAERLKLQRSSTSRALYHYIKSIEKCASVPVRCITVKSPDSLYLAGKSLIPTHNSTLLTIFVLWSTCFNDDYRAAIVANKEATAVNIFKRIRLAYEQLPNYIKPGVKDYAKTGMTLGNDSSIIVSTTTATSIRGDTLNCISGDSLISYRVFGENFVELSVRELYDSMQVQEHVVGNSCVKFNISGEVNTSVGWSSFLGIKKTVLNTEGIQIFTESGKLITTTLEHLVFLSEKESKEASEFVPGDPIYTECGTETVSAVNRQFLANSEWFDVVETNDNTFFANGIKVHNCICLDEAAFIECLHDETTIQIRNKHTKEIKTLTIKEAIGLFESQND